MSTHLFKPPRSFIHPDAAKSASKKARRASAAAAAAPLEDEAPASSGAAASAASSAVDFMIKPDAKGAALDTSRWPLLLKHYDQLNVRTGHYTPIPSGHSPLARPLREYLSYG